MGERQRSDHTILLAEDSPLLLEMLKKCLTKAGYTHLVPTTNGLEAWNKLDRMMNEGAVVGKDISMDITLQRGSSPTIVWWDSRLLSSRHWLTRR